MADRDAPGPAVPPRAFTTEPYDGPTGAAFREVVRRFAEMGYGRMAQIVDEEWRRKHPITGGLVVICGKCQTLINVGDGSPR